MYFPISFYIFTSLTIFGGYIILSTVLSAHLYLIEREFYPQCIILFIILSLQLILKNPNLFHAFPNTTFVNDFFAGMNLLL